MAIFKDAINNFLSPIRDLLEDESISEVMINGPFEIFVEKKGLIEKVSHTFRSEDELIVAFRSIAQSVGRVIDEENPRLDARLPNGSRIHVVLSPVAKNGTIASIRKFSQQELTLKDLIKADSLSETAARFLDVCVHLGKNIVVSGETGSGKTTLLNVLASRMPKTQRLIVIEDTAELQIHADHVVQLETRKGDPTRQIEKITVRDLVYSAMRLRPDRIIVGEVRGEEALDLIQVMNTGHNGSMGTVHANNPMEACTRLESLCLIGDTRIPPDAIRKMVGSAMQIIVQCSRYHDGGRRISRITEILGVDFKGNYICRDIFRWLQKGKEENGRFIGEMASCNYVPYFFEEIVVNKLPFPKNHFVAPSWATPFLKKAA